MFAVTKTKSCTREQSHKLTANPLHFQFITAWQATSLSPLLSERINSSGDPLRPCPRTGNLHYYGIFKTKSSRPKGLEDGALFLCRDKETRQRSSRAAVSCETVAEKPTDLIPNPGVHMGKAGAETYLGKDSAFSHKTYFSSEPHKPFIKNMNPKAKRWSCGKHHLAVHWQLPAFSTALKHYIFIFHVTLAFPLRQPASLSEQTPFQLLALLTQPPMRVRLFFVLQ